MSSRPLQPLWSLARLVVLISSMIGAAAGTADEPDYGDLLPRISPREPAAALESFHVAEGFKIELAAAEPLVMDPVAMAFDEDGRLYVVEMRDYSENDSGQPGRVRRLEDIDGDGTFDRSTVYLDGLSWPTAIICWDGGVFVGAAPDILYVQDTDGDGTADRRRVVFTGFGRENVQGLLNSFQWGLDGRIYGATSSSGGRVRRADAAENEAVDLRGRDFAFDPRTLELEAISGGGQHGLTFDDWGRRFVCSNSNHLQMVLCEDRYLARNRWLSAPPAVQNIAADGPQAAVYRTSPAEPWRLLRTRLRVAGVVPGPVEGGGRAVGYFTSATGITVYRGGLWPKESDGTVLVADVGSNLIHRKRLTEQSARLRAERMDDASEFVTSEDVWFRPVQMANGPDGVLYVADMYREVVEHPASLPPAIKQHLDLNHGNDRGRIYRIVPTGYGSRRLPMLSQHSTAQLVDELAHPNGWRRDTASRLLVERQSEDAVEPLRRLLSACSFPQARLHALYVLENLQAISVADLRGALKDPHPRVREHALRLAEPRLRDAAEVREQVLGLIDDPDPGVRLQLAFALGACSGADIQSALLVLARRDSADAWMRVAVQSSLADSACGLLVALLRDADFRQRAESGSWFRPLARQVGGQARDAELRELAATLDELPAQATAIRVTMAGLASGLAEHAGPWRARLADAAGRRVEELLQEVVETSRRLAHDQALPVAERVSAIELLGQAGDRVADARLASLLDTGQPSDVQRAAIGALSRIGDQEAGQVLCAALPALPPEEQSLALDQLLSRPAFTHRLLAALDNRELSADVLSAAHRARLRNHPDPGVRQQADRLFENSRRTIDSLLKDYQSALGRNADVDRGRALFKQHCSGCHRADGVGHEIGPSLSAMKSRGQEALLIAVLDPHREVNPQFVSYTLTTNDGRVLTGLITAESSSQIVLKRAEGIEESVSRAEVQSLQSSGKSLMPEGFEQQLDPQAMADLLAYLTGAQ